VELSDEVLCRKVASREAGAFDLIVERYQGRAYRIAWSILRDREEARDCSQEAFIKLYDAAGTFGGQSKFSTWFYRILVNCCLDHRRKTRGWRRLLASSDPPRGGDENRDLVAEQPAPFVDPADGLDDERRMNRLWSAVEGLSPQQRAVVLLQCREGLATKEISKIMNLSEATVRVHLHRAFAALRRRVGGES
jgi:RNA polymerase sigma-70 factor (ECF subfamily)